MSSPQDEIKRELHAVANKLNEVRDEEARLKGDRLALMRAARESGMSFQAIGDLLGVTKAYVHQQIAVKAKEPENSQVPRDSGTLQPSVPASTPVHDVDPLTRNIIFDHNASNE